MRPHVLRPQAGTIPILGMRGAPILDQQGELVGLLSSVSHTRTISGRQYILSMSDIPWSTLDSLLAN